MEFLIKVIIGGIIIASVVTVAQRGNPTMGALILGIPLSSIVSIIFMYHAGVDVSIYTQLAIETVYFVLVSLAFFPIFAYMVYLIPFWPALIISTSISMSGLYVLKLFLER